MRGVNKVILMGNLGADPEVRVTKEGTSVVNLRLATGKSYKDRDGNLVEKTEWHNLVAWDKAAEILGDYTRKGDRLYVEGELQTRKWEDQDGNDRYTTEIVVREFSLETPKGDREGQGKPENTDENGRAPAAQRPTARKGRKAPAVADDDIPF